MGETPAKKPGSRPSLSFVFAHTSDGHKQSPMLMQSDPWWLRCRKWLNYHTIQLRWDVERHLARLFHRRWGA
jgi:hypothetical protein